MYSVSRIVTFFVVASLLLSSSKASDHIDSLRQLATGAESREEVSILIGLADAYRQINADSARYFSEKAYKLAQDLNDKDGSFEAANLLAVSFFRSSDYSAAVIWGNNALRMAKRMEDSSYISKCYNNIGLFHLYQREYSQAIEMLMQAIEMRELMEDPKLSSSVNNMGIVYMKMEDYPLALEYFEKAAQLKEEQGYRQSLSNTINNIGIINNRIGNYDEAITYFQQSLDLAREFNDLVKQARALNNIAGAYEHKGDLRMAKTYYLNAIRIKENLNNRSELINSWFNLAGILVKTGEHERAFRYLQKADSLSEIVGDHYYEVNLLIAKSDYYQALGDYQEALKQMELAMHAKVENLNQERNEKIAELEVKYETARKDLKIQRLEAEEKIKEAELGRAQSRLAGILIASLLLIALMILLYVYRNKRAKLEKIAFENQINRLKQRIVDIQSSDPLTFDRKDLEGLNDKIPEPLTGREIDILEKALEGNSNKQISEKLHVSVNTVKFHLKNIYAKLGVANKQEIIEYVAVS